MSTIWLGPDDDLEVVLTRVDGKLELHGSLGGQNYVIEGRDRLVLTTQRCPDPTAHVPIPRPSLARRLVRAWRDR